MIIEENPDSEVSPSGEESPIPEVSPSVEESPIPESFPSSKNLPSLEDLGPPEFESRATEYDTEFVLEEESEALGSVLKDLGWDQEED